MKIYFLNLEKLKFTASLFDDYRIFLDEEDCERLGKLRVADVKRNFVFGRFLIRKNLSAILDCAPGDIKLKKTKNGRPELDLVNCNFNAELAQNLSFNISHAKDLVCLAVSQDKIGIDVEFKKERDFHKIAQEFFSEEEAESLSNLFGDELKNKFYTYWTLKESFVKCNGDSILNKNSLKTQNSSKNYQFFTYEIDDYIMSITIKSTKIQTPKISEICLNPSVSQKKELKLI